MKWFNTPPSQGGIHGSESRTDHHVCNETSLASFFIAKIIFKPLVIIIVKFTTNNFYAII